MHEYLVNRGYRAILNVDILSGIGDSLYNIVFIIYASTLPFKMLAVSLASMATLIPALLSIIAGYYADQTQHKTQAMLWIKLVQFLIFMILSLIIVLPASLVLFLALLMMNIVSDTLDMYSSGLSLPLLKKLVPISELNAALGLTSASMTTVQLIFQGLGASLIVLMDYNYSFFGFINALTFLFAAILLFAVRQVLTSKEPKTHLETATGGQSRRSMFKGIWQTMKGLRKNSFLFAVAILCLFINVIGASISGLVNVALLSEKPFWLVNYGYTVALVNICMSVGTVLGSLFTKDMFKNWRLLPLMMACTAAMFFLALAFIWGHSLIILVVAISLTGYMLGKVNPRITSTILISVDETHIASVNGMFQMMALLGAPIGQVIFLGIANATSPIMSWDIFAGTAIVLVILVGILSRKVSEPISKAIEKL